MRLSTVLPLAIAPAALARGGRMRRTSHLGGAEAGLGVDVGHAGVGSVGAGVGGHVGAVAVPGHVGLVSGVNAVVIWVNEGGGAAAQTINEQVTVTKTVTAGAEPTEVANTVIDAGATGVVEGVGATHEVTVGGDQGLSYFPQEVSAQVGDMIIFTFYAMNHTVTQSTFDNACTPMEGGMDSGFMPNPDNSIDPPPQVAMQVMTEDPIWMYCAQGNHCGQGMVFSINPTQEKTHAQFQANAIAQNGDGAATGITGGEGVPPAEDSAAATMAGGQETAAETAADTAVDTAASTDVGAALPTSAGVAAPSASAPGGATLGGGIVMGEGVMAEDGSCHCAVQCSGGSFPDPAAQGVNAFGGIAGSISMDSIGGQVGASAGMSAGVSAPSAGVASGGATDASAGVTSAASVATDATAENGGATATEGGDQAATGGEASADVSATGGGDAAAEAPPAPVNPARR